MKPDTVKTYMARIVEAMDAQIAHIEKTGPAEFYGEVFDAVPKADYWVTMGRGRSGHVADKVSASLASTGTPSYFKNLLDDVAHAAHLAPSDRVLLFQRRGDTFEEVAQLFSILPEGVPVDVITDRAEGWPDRPGVHMELTDPGEATSVEGDVVSLALGDSLLSGMEAALGFTELDFVMDHPKGNLAKLINEAKEKGLDQKPNYPPAAEQALASFKAEREGVAALADELDLDVVSRWLGLFSRRWKRVITTGMGKPGYCMRYLTVLLTELGYSAFYLHPAEGVHGDLGRIGPKSLMIGYSHSGTTAEVTSILPRAKERGAVLLALTNNPESELGQAADVVVKSGAPEVDPIGRAPTGSTTATLALATSLVRAASE